MNREKIKVFAPATVANVACGFDIFGFALEQPGDEVIVSLIDKPGVFLKSISGDGGKLPFDPHKNAAAISVIRFLEQLQYKGGVEIELEKKMPLESGLGSSAASAVASLFAVNALLGEPLAREELLPFAIEAERKVCGAAHADNAAPALLGGFVLIRSYSPLHVIKIPIAIQLYCTIIHLQIEIRTEAARKLLKRELSLEEHIIQSGNAAALIAGLIQGKAEIIKSSLHDIIAEPVRASLIPGFNEMKAAALREKALGCSISGSGPSLFALSLSWEQANHIGHAMQRECRAKNLKSDLYISPINQEGAKII
jgi:homoserine kinase